VIRAQALDPVLARHDALPRKLVGDKPVPEGRVVGVDVQGSVDQVRIIQSRSVTGLVFHL
jgi:hypothetical protein